MMNKCNEEFMKRNEIDFSGIDTTIYDIEDINEIVGKYEIQGQRISEEVSIENILGLYNEKGLPHSFPEILDSFFDENGDGYHSRSVGMLQYDENNVIDRLNSSFRLEPMVLIECDMCKFMIFTNGMHRFIVMRMLYLSAKSKCQNEIELNKLIEKYTIPVEVVKVDFVKTYCKYLIDLFQPVSCMGEYYANIEKTIDENGKERYELTKIKGYGKYEIIYLSKEDMGMLLKSYTKLENEYDNNFKRTGRCILKEFSGVKHILTDDELILFTRRIINESGKSKKELFELLRIQSEKYESFNQFLKMYFNDMIDYGIGEDVEYGSIKRK